MSIFRLTFIFVHFNNFKKDSFRKAVRLSNKQNPRNNKNLLIFKKSLNGFVFYYREFLSATSLKSKIKEK